MEAEAMSNYEEAAERLTDSTDLGPRGVRALTEYLTVLPEYGRAKDADELFIVVSESGSEYLVDARDDVCECPDYQYREAHCKHLRRVEYATGKRTIPAWIDPTAVDAQIGYHVETSPMLAATDGGVTVEASEDTEAHDDCRPEGCDCGEWCPDDLPCWLCFREGFKTPNPKKGKK
ncbi:hypothetical protein [Haloarcula sp. K1]|uniref:hypothetical protein n=1 Tax=Haloarcula sp. K1 TaxID=1622207 RepID=UPI0007DA37B6|nr:hypothetical protein [Haloarcula sp. K1]